MVELELELGYCKSIVWDTGMMGRQASWWDMKTVDLIMKQVLLYPLALGVFEAIEDEAWVKRI